MSLIVHCFPAVFRLFYHYFFLLGLVIYHFVTFGVHFLPKMTHSSTKTIYQMFPSLCIVYQVLRSAFTHAISIVKMWWDTL